MANLFSPHKTKLDLSVKVDHPRLDIDQNSLAMQNLRATKLQSLPSKFAPITKISNIQVDDITSLSHLAQLSRQVLDIETAARRMVESREKLIDKSFGAESFVDKSAFKTVEPSFMQTVNKDIKGEQFNFLTKNNKKGRFNPNLTFSTNKRSLFEK